ncbi:hypothetical protein [Petroclostridium sp. X23]|uniref:hypothetical protein n=1 Tax=Petroclostridium sp. X23 TaxID=3045146 RepID=UPI0024AD07E9|nr:hypothetical protein [Petroclostridium sp. X23]WHH57573.1 hypothetical protein QKW49_17285 [Petroclostridium sp. X23]
MPKPGKQQGQSEITGKVLIVRKSDTGTGPQSGQKPGLTADQSPCPISSMWLIGL